MRQRRQEYTMGENAVSSTNGAGKVGKYMQKMHLDHFPTTYTKINSK